MGEHQKIKANQAAKPTQTHKLESAGMNIIKNEIHKGLLDLTQLCYTMGEHHPPMGLLNRDVFKVHSFTQELDVMPISCQIEKIN